jgi:molecular chaperone IbpA
MTLSQRFSFSPLYNSTLGFEQLFGEVEQMLASTPNNNTQTSFPPHNIVKVDEYHYVVELAVAGYNKSEIDIKVDDGHLIIKGNKDEQSKNVDLSDIEYLHRGIGLRSFTKTVKIADTVEVRGAEYTDGILRIGLENVIPEHKKPRNIEISDEALNLFKPELLNEGKAGKSK